jgi:hypothetical protein
MEITHPWASALKEGTTGKSRKTIVAADIFTCMEGTSEKRCKLFNYQMSQMWEPDV